MMWMLLVSLPIIVWGVAFLSWTLWHRRQNKRRPPSGPMPMMFEYPPPPVPPKVLDRR